MEHKPQVIAVDVDKTLTMGTCWTVDEMLNAEPNQKVIDWVNSKYASNFIVIHTARRHEMYDATVRWLKKHNVHFHAVHMDKLAADYYLDDRAVRPEEVLKSKKDNKNANYQIQGETNTPKRNQQL